MNFVKDGSTYIIVLSQGEAVGASLHEFCSKENIVNATFSGLGAVRGLECGYYDLEERQYHFQAYQQLLEVASLSGNIILKDGKPFVHMHGVFTDTDNDAFGGHIKEMTVGVTLEITLVRHETSLSRKHDEGIGLFLINCPLDQDQTL